jgi:exonuclease III
LIVTGESVHLFNVYFPNGGRGDDRISYKLKFYDAFYEHCEKLIKSNSSVIVVGDVNTAHKEIDSFEAQVSDFFESSANLFSYQIKSSLRELDFSQKKGNG